MPLEKRTLPISFAQGIDTKTDPKQLVMGKMLVLQNAVFQTTNSFRKRNGYQAITSSLSSGNGLAAYANELVELDGTSLYSYSAKQNTTNLRGSAPAIAVTTTAVVRNSYQQTNPDSAIHSSGFSVFAWNDSNGGVRYSVFDSVTNQAIVANAVLSATGINPKVKVIGSYVVIIYVDNPTTTPTLSYQYINSSTPTSIAGPVTLQSMTVNLFAYDAVTINNRLFIVAQVDANDAQVFYLSTGLVQSTPVALVYTGLNLLNIFGDSSNNVWLGVVQTTGGNTLIGCQIYNFNLSSIVLALTNIETITGNNQVKNLTGIVPVSTATFYYEFINSTGNSYDEFIRTNTITVGGTVGSAADFIRSVGLASKAFLNGSTIYVAVVHDSVEQPTYFVIDGSKNVVAKIAPSNGGGLYKTGQLPEVNSPSASNYQFPVLEKDLLASQSGTIYSQTGVFVAGLAFNSSGSVPLNTITLANDLHVGGGFLSMYDGASVVEQNFHLYPENVSEQLAYTGGGLGIGSYQYSTLYEWTDNQGQIHRSAPSTPVTVDNTQGSLFITGNIAAGTPNAITVDPTNPTFGLLAPGMLLGNSNLQTNTILTGKQFSASNVEFDPAPISNATNQLITVTPNLELTISTSAGSPTINVSNQEINTAVMLDTVQSATTAHCYNPTGLRPGMAPAALNPSAVSGYIVSVSGNTITMSGGTVAASQTFVQQQFQMFIKGDFTAGLNTVSNVSIWSGGSLPLSLSGSLFANQELFNTAASNPITPGTLISSIGVSSLVLNQVAANTILGAIINVGTYVANHLVVGQAIQSTSGLGIPSGSTIKSISVPNITISAPATSTQTNIQAFTPDIGIVRLTLPTLRVTAKRPPIPNATIVVYRTIANGSVFYRISSLTAPISNDTTIDSKIFVDAIPDSQIIGNETLYTTGGEVDNGSIPASNLFSSYKNRMIAVTSEDPLTWWYSKQVIAGSPVEFSPFFTSRVSELDGPITAVAQLDDKLIFFKKNSIYFVTGDGPAPNGTNNDFTEAQLITADAGCINPRSIVTLPIGVMFQSTKGIYLLERSLQATYIGKDVEAYNSQTITSSKLIEGNRQVRFGLASGVVLNYDYFFNQWSVFTNLNVADATIFQDLYTFLTPAGAIRQETVGQYTDNSAFIPISLTMSWLSFAGLEGYQRAYKFLVLGDYESPHALTATINYDFATLNTQTVSIPVTSPPTGPYQYRIFLQQQKNESFQVTLTETQAGPTYGEGLRLSALAVEVGLKKGLRKMPAANSYG